MEATSNTNAQPTTIVEAVEAILEALRIAAQELDVDFLTEIDEDEKATLVDLVIGMMDEGLTITAAAADALDEFLEG